MASHHIVTCVPAGEGVQSVSPCYDMGGVTHHPAVVTIEVPDAMKPVHFGNADQLFSYGFSIVLAMFAIGVCIGAIHSLIRRGA